MTATSEITLEKLASIRKTNLEAQMIELIAERRQLSVEDALDLYYSSNLSRMIEANEYGLRYLDANYLAEELFRALDA